jgi:cell shape-determining protein MreD
MITWLHTLLLLVAAILAVFGEAAFQGLRHWLGAQVDLLPAFMVFAGLRTNLATVIGLALLGGLCFDSLSANPLGVSVLPLFVLGLGLHVNRELILRDQPFAQLVLGGAASVFAPLLTLLLLLTTGRRPLLGWGTIWQLAVAGSAGAAVTPLVFQLMAWLDHLLGQRPALESTFRPDREIRRGRS